jgi:putative DNA primase/helicase
MAIYLQKGTTNSNLVEQDTGDLSDFDWLIRYKPQASGASNPPAVKQFKANNEEFFTAGDYKVLKRSNNNLLSRSILLGDYENIDDEKAFLTDVKTSLKNFNYYLYPSISYGFKGPRWRLAVDLSRSVVRDEYKPLLNYLNSILNYDTDVSASQWSQIMGLPVLNKFSKELPKQGQIIHTGKVPLDVEKVLSMMATAVKAKPKTPAAVAPDSIRVHSIEDEKAIEILTEWASNHKEDLEEEDYFSVRQRALICYQTEGTISGKVVDASCKIFAGVDPEQNWEADNRAKLAKQRHSNKESPFEPQLVSFEDFFQVAPKTMKDLKKFLSKKGKAWRDEHTTVNDNTGVVKVPRVPVREVAYIIEHYVNVAVIGENENDIEKARPAYYDLDTGIYKNSERRLDQLILAIEDTSNKRACEQIRVFLQREAPEKRVTKDRHLIVCNNGIYDQRTKKLLSFDPKYIFKTKISTNYNPDVKEPRFNGWCFSDWVAQIAGHDHDKEKLIWQMIAATCNSNYNMESIFMLVDNGQGRTGKSTMEQILMNLVGEDNYASLKLLQFEEPFLLANAADKALIIGDDNNPNDYNSTSENFKSVVTGEPILVNPKFEKPFSTRFNCVIVQSANGMPRFADNTDALLRRFRIIKFNQQYKATPASKRIKDEYIKDRWLLEYILFRALQIELDKDSLADTEESRNAIHELKLDNDPVAYFIEKYMDNLKSTRVPVKFLFHYFLVVMKNEENNPQSIKQNTFTKRAKPILAEMGWRYEPKNLAPLEAWHQDEEKLAYDGEWSNFEIKPLQKQPLFVNTEKD